MKKACLLLLLSIGLCTAQKKDCYLAVSTGVDIRNAVIGSDPVGNKPAYDGMFQFNVVGANVEMNFGYETFSKIKYDRMFAGIGYHFPLYLYAFNEEIRTIFIPSFEASMIEKTITENYVWNGVLHVEDNKYGFLAYGLNFAWQWNLTDDFAVQLATKVCQRPDLQYQYDVNKTEVANYFKIIYMFNKN